MTSRIATLQQSLPFFEWYGSSPHQERGGQPGVVDLLFGNPHDMPIPAYVEALQRHVVPQHPGWFAYMFDDEGATGTAADGLRRHTGMDWDPDDIAMTNGGWGAIAVGIRALVEPGDEVIYYDPPWFFYDLLIRGAEATPVTLRLEPPRFSPDPAALAAAITPEDARGPAQHAAQPDGADPRRRRARRGRRGAPCGVRSPRAADLPAVGRGVPPDRARRAARAEPRRALRAHARPLLVREAAARARPADRLPRALAADPDEERATLREAVRTAQFVNSYSWPNALLQRALPDIADLVVDIAALERRRDRLVPALAELGYEPTTPEGTFYVLARSPIEDDKAFVARLAEDDVFVLPGSTINLPGWFRISLTASDEMIEASIERFAAAREPVRA